MKTHSYDEIAISELKQYDNNTRTHSEEQVAQIVESIKQFGFTNPVLVDENLCLIAGHGRTAAAKILGIEKIPCIRISGLSEAEVKALRIADNQLALNAGWDEELLKVELADLASNDFNLDILGFSPDDLENLMAELDAEDSAEDETYTAKVEAPIYEPQMEKAPPLIDLCDKTKYNELCEEISASSVPKEVKEFLSIAAARHLKFDYKMIAEYYAHADKQTQDLMEKSALVIIDFNKAIENGFVKMTNRLSEIMGAQDA